MLKKLKWLWISFIAFVIALLIFIFVPIKYNASLKKSRNDLRSTVEIVMLRGVEYISEESLNDVICIEEKYNESMVNKYEYTMGGNDIYMHLVSDENDRRYLGYTYNLQNKKILGKNYLSLNEINKVNNFEFDLKGKELLIKKAEGVVISPETALNIGIEVILYVYPEFDGAEYSLWVIEKEDIYEVSLRLKGSMGASLVAEIGKSSGATRKVYVEY